MKIKEKIIFIAVIIISSVLMLYWIIQKEGFHEDEIFSYGSSNYKLDNVYQRYGKKDAANQIIFDKILNGSFSEKLDNIKYYIGNTDKFMEEYNEILKDSKPVWKTSKEAREYLTIGKGDIFNLFSIYYNQSRDVHPFLFYLLVHIFSCIFYGMFSKYIIFLINLIFFILSCIVIKKILKLLDKDHLSIPVVLLYGLSIGAASIMVFLRMYQMLTFFALASIYLYLQIIKENFEIDKKTRNQVIAVTILGFLTQYYYCIFALFEVMSLVIILLKNKKYDTLKKLIKYHIISAVIRNSNIPSKYISYILFI